MPRRRPPWPVRLMIGLILPVFVGLIGMWWYLDRQSNWGVVVPGKIYRSAEVSRFLIKNKLTENKIGVIVYLSRDGENNADMTKERQVAAELHLPILEFPMSGDGLARPDRYPAALEAVYQANQEGKPVLIHCHSGAQRTSGVVAVYRVLVEGKSPQEAVAEMKHYGHDPKKNTVLIPFLNEHLGEWAQELASRGIIAKVPQPLPRFTE